MQQNIKIDPYGFREYDARWLYEKDINIAGIKNLGKGLGTQIIIHTKKNNPFPKDSIPFKFTFLGYNHRASYSLKPKGSIFVEFSM